MGFVSCHGNFRVNVAIMPKVAKANRLTRNASFRYALMGLLVLLLVANIGRFARYVHRQHVTQAVLERARRAQAQRVERSLQTVVYSSPRPASARDVDKDDDEPDAGGDMLHNGGESSKTREPDAGPQINTTHELATDCCICLEEFEEGEELTAPECGHVFHPGCLQEWIRRARLDHIPCPVCRYTIVEPEVRLDPELEDSFGVAPL